ncbi:MAG: pesticin C-terminus-like muramidase [Alphaproteobacteria bacterium]|nr:pesticin C-terminus-like muramidase [Alphaproteobacteria bacterium]
MSTLTDRTRPFITSPAILPETDHPNGLLRSLATVPAGAVDRVRRTVAVVASTELIDRAGDRVLVEGWQLDAYRRNPVVLFAHRDRDPPIGRALEVSVRNGRLTAVLQFADAATYPFADQVFRLIADGYLNAVSVGFRPLTWVRSSEPTRKGGKDILTQELLEISVVPIPCQPDARIVGRSFSPRSPRLALAQHIGRGIARALFSRVVEKRHDIRWPAGSPDGVGGQFAPGVGGGGQTTPLTAQTGRPTASPAPASRTTPPSPPANRRGAQDGDPTSGGPGNPGLRLPPRADTGSIDWEQIRFLENQFNIGPHIPGGGSNGVTVGPGINLGALGERELNGLSEILQNKLRPWVGKTMEKEPGLRQKLNREQLNLSNKEIMEITDARIKYHYDNLSKNFERQTGKPFTSLPPDMQTIAMSLAWRVGPTGATSTNRDDEVRRLWEAVKTGDRGAMIKALEGAKADPKRFEKEIAYLRRHQ